MAETIGTAYVQIEPSFDGAVQKIDKQFGGAGAASGKSFTSGFGVAMRGFGVATVAAGAAIGAMGAKLASASSEAASYGDHVDKMSQKMGISAEAYQEWDAVMQHSGTTIDALKPAMKTLAVQAEKGGAAFEKLGISEQEVASLSTEDLFAKVITGLQGMEEGTERTYLTSQLLGRGATELGALLNTSAEETQAMRDRVHELGGVMSDEAVKAAAAYTDQLQDMTTAFQSISRNMAAEFLPALTEIMGGLTEIFSGDSDKGLGMISDGINDLVDKITEVMPKIAETATKIIEAFATAIINNLPQLVQTGFTIVDELVHYILDNIPLLINTGLQILTELANGIGEALPTLIPTIVDVMIQVVQTIIDNLPMLVEAAVGIVKGLAEGIVNALPILIEAMPELVTSLVEAIVESLPILIEGVIQLVTGIVNALPDIIVALVDAIPQIIEAVVSGLLQCLPQLIVGVVQLVLALVDALPEIMVALYNAMPEIIQGIVEAVIACAPMFVEAGKQLFIGLVQAWSDIGPQLMAGVGQTMADLIADVSSYLAQLPERMSYFAGYAVGSFIKFMKNLPSNLASLWSTIIANAKSFGQNFIQLAPKMAKQFAEQLVNGLKALPGQMITIGKQIVDGMLQGIQNAWNRMTGVVYQMVQAFIEGIKASLLIGSPSKVMADEVGRWIPAGIAVGIQNGMGVLDNAVASMTQEIIGTNTSAKIEATMSSAVPQIDTNVGSGAAIELLATYLPIIAAEISKPIEVNQNDRGMFSAVRSENAKLKTATGYHALA